MNLDLLTLYAYSDRVHAKDRELWRGFLSFLLPVLLEIESAEIDRLVEAALSRSAEDVLAQLSEPSTPQSVLRVISAQLAQTLDLPAEMGIACFLEINVPTRAHLVKPSSLKIKDETVVARWLNRFTKAQHHEEFAEMVALWKEQLAEFYDGDELKEQDAEDMPESADELVARSA